jgi:hypothetical protein
MRTVSIGNMIKSITGMLGTDDLTEWETGFIERIAEMTNDGQHTSLLSDKQVETVENIYKKHFA